DEDDGDDEEDERDRQGPVRLGGGVRVEVDGSLAADEGPGVDVVDGLANVGHGGLGGQGVGGVGECGLEEDGTVDLGGCGGGLRPGGGLRRAAAGGFGFAVGVDGQGSARGVCGGDRQGFDPVEVADGPCGVFEVVGGDDDLRR